MRSEVPVEFRLDLAAGRRSEWTEEPSQHASFRAVRHRQALVVRRALAGVLIAVVLASLAPSPAPAQTIRWTFGFNKTCGVDL